jgi:hypothetical protein
MDGVLEEHLPYITMTPLWQDGQTGNHPEIPIYPIIRVADCPIVYPYSLPRHSTAPHNAAECSKGTRNVPEKSVMPQAYFILPEVL